MAPELNHEEVHTPPRDAASVLLMRDADDGALEILLLRRSEGSDVLAGAYVFPGGKVDPADAALVEQRGDLEAFRDACWRALGEETVDSLFAAAMFAAAARETEEEAGVRLDPGALLPFSRWITPRVPSMMRKRFDTRFFVAPMPEGASASHDEHEAVESVWIRPRRALEQYWNHEIALAPPQIMSLAHLARFSSASDAMSEIRSRRPHVVEPEPFQLDGVRAVAYPGDPRHPVAVRAMPGPSRLIWRNGRFEPESGFDAFFV